MDTPARRDVGPANHQPAMANTNWSVVARNILRHGTHPPPLPKEQRIRGARWCDLTLSSKIRITLAFLPAVLCWIAVVKFGALERFLDWLRTLH